MCEISWSNVSSFSKIISCAEIRKARILVGALELKRNEFIEFSDMRAFKGVKNKGTLFRLE